MFIVNLENEKYGNIKNVFKNICIAFSKGL